MRTRRCSGLGRDDFAAVIMAASRAHVVRQLQFAAVRAFLERSRLEPMMAAAHVPLRRRSFSLRDSHCGTFEIFGTTIKIATICASSRQGSFWGLPAGGGRIVANRGSYSAWRRCSKRSVGVRGRPGGGNDMMLVPVTLISTAAAVLLNFWLSWRIGSLREEYKVSV